MTKYRPFGNNIVIKKRDDEAPSSLLTVITQEKPEVMYADVLAVGSEVTDIKAGDVIATKYYAGSEYDGVIFLADDAVMFTVDA